MRATDVRQDIWMTASLVRLSTFIWKGKFNLRLFLQCSFFLQTIHLQTLTFKKTRPDRLESLRVQ